MKKRLVSLLALLALLLSLSAAAYAAQDQFLFDPEGRLSAEERQTLDALGARIYSETGVAVCACLTRETGESVHDFAESFYQSNIGEAEGILLVHNPAEGLISYAVHGQKLSALGDEGLMELVDAYNKAPTYFDGVHDFFNLTFSRLGGASIPSERRYDRVVDFAGVLDASRLASLNTLADSVSESYRCDVAVVFVSSLEGRSVVDYADDFYDYNGYGYGESDDGILLLISVNDREFAESTFGYGATAFTDYGLTNYIEPNFTSYLANGRDDWAGAAQQFINDAGKLLAQARNGQPYDNYGSSSSVREKSFGEKAGFAAILSAVIGFFSGGIPTGAMKRKMKSVEKEYGAANYVRGGLNLRRSDDRFLYANVAKTPIPRERSSGGGGSTMHISSSGRSHGGSHGKF